MNKSQIDNGTRSDPLRQGVRFMVGRDADGRWIVSDRDGKVGGLFTDRASAVHFAMFESDHQPGAVCCMPESETLSLGAAFEIRAIGRRSRVAGRA